GRFPRSALFQKRFRTTRAYRRGEAIPSQSESAGAMRNEKYILNEAGNPVAEPDLQKWGEWLQTSPARHVGDDTIGPSRVSTVFLGLDHQFGEGQPILWETMVFGGPLKDEMDRCSGSREQAEAM